MDSEDPTPITHERPKPTVPVLSYRAPKDDPPPASAMDVIKAAVAICIGIGMLLGIVATSLSMLTTWLREGKGDRIPGILGAALGVLLYALGAWLSYRCVRDYLSGWNRRRRAARLARPAGNENQDSQT